MVLFDADASALTSPPNELAVLFKRFSAVVRAVPVRPLTSQINVLTVLPMAVTRPLTVDNIVPINSVPKLTAVCAKVPTS